MAWKMPPTYALLNNVLLIVLLNIIKYYKFILFRLNEIHQKLNALSSPYDRRNTWAFKWLMSDYVKSYIVITKM